MKRTAVYENKTLPIFFEFQKCLTTWPHFHKELEIIFVAEGSSQTFTDSKKENLSKGELFISFPNQIHYFENCSLGKYLVMILSPHIFYGTESILNDMIPGQNVMKNVDAELHNLFFKAKETTGPYENTIKMGLVNQALGLILSNIELIPKIKTNNSTLLEILDFCFSNSASNLTLDTLSEKLHISKYHISHLLNDKLGVGFNEYINTVRIKKACNLIESTEKKMADISEETGFGSIRSFNRAFQKNMNMSPCEYRNQFQ